MRDRESGFTLIEVIVALAVVSILAAIALPSFLGESRKSKAFSEVQPMFNDIRIRLEQHLQEAGHYPITTGEIAYHPPTTGPTKTALEPYPTEWTDLKIRISGNDEVYCSYTWSTGAANVNTNIGTLVRTAKPAGFGFATPTVEWYYVLAKCDMDGLHSATPSDSEYSWYFASSVNPTIDKLNEGK